MSAEELQTRQRKAPVWSILKGAGVLAGISGIASFLFVGHKPWLALDEVP